MIPTLAFTSGKCLRTPFTVTKHLSSLWKPQTTPKIMICNIPQAYRAYSPSPVMFSAAGEDKLKRILKENFPQATEIEVQDVSGGCGSMYQIYIEAEEFRGKKLVEQQRMVNSVLQAEIKGMHGLTLQTAVPSPLKNKPP